MKSFFKDSLINIISNMIIVVAIQLIVFPTLNKIEDKINFSNVIVMYGYIMILSTALSNTLTSTRLISSNSINIMKRHNVFSSLFCLISIINIIITTTLLLIYKIDLVTSCGLLLFSIFIFTRYYLAVYMREELNYIRILNVNILIFLSYLVGIYIYIRLDINYSFVFVIGELLGLLTLMRYIYFIDRKPLNFRITFDKDIYLSYMHLTIINFIINLLNYFDRIILLPIIGPVAVNVYFIASSAGKMVSLVTTPINNVILSYIAKKEIKKEMILKILMFLTVILIPLFYVIKYSSILYINIFYNNYLEQASNIISYVSVICCLSLVISIVHPFTIKIIESLLLLKLQIFYCIFYVLLSLILTPKYGLIGYCIATSIYLFVKLALTFLILLNKNKSIIR
ncbi:lipopolysaccharide biosynthesis protein [Macrococcoides canis]|uniref:lipopolysaccharide biosynthesis protein n=1 Tax=Macrococcoides canis TaxID=1855823 RepID=UPI0020B6ABC2|nr:hypothetical protein [Macrococcus canis]UTH12347.1 hypothetical protein KFV10_04390 [Macrococcus canis]